MLEKTASVSNRELTELRRLRPEPTEVRPVRGILDSLGRAAAALDQMRAAADSESWSRVDAEAARVQALSKKADRLVGRYGLHECLSDDG